MTGHAAHSLIQVNAVIEVDVIRQVIYTHPFHRRVVAKALPDRLKGRTVGINLGVTIHAGLGWRDAGERAFLDRGVTIAAIDSDVADMVLVTEWDRLHPDDMVFRQPGRSHYFSRCDCHRHNDEHSAEDGEPRNEVHSSAEDLAHSRPMISRRMPLRKSSVDAPYTR